MKNQKINNKPYDEEILLVNLPVYLKNDIDALEEGLKNKVSYVDSLINEVQGSANSACVDGRISEEQRDYIFKKYVYEEE